MALPIDFDDARQHIVTDPAIDLFRQGISLLQGVPPTSPTVRAQADVLLKLCRRRRVEDVRGFVECRPPYLQLAMELQGDDVHLNVKFARGRFVDASVNEIHK